MKKNNIIILLATIVVIVLAFLLFTKPEITIKYNGEEVKNMINVEVNSNFVFPMYNSKYLNKNITNEVTMNGEVDTSKIGSYEIKYSLHHFIYNVSRIITVNVLDRTIPDIVLNGSNPSNSCSIQSYKEEGYTANDNYDGDITDKVVVEKSEDTIRYSVKDTSDNKVSIERKILVNDETPPSIKLKGKDTIRVELNKEYKDEGVKVSDNCDTEVEVNTESNVDYSKVGVYEITYTATDSSGNTSSIKRNIYVYDSHTTANINGGEKGVIYLTFDDGPSIYTTKILDTLSKYNIKATFFVTNNGKDSVIKREFKEGHTVALHTASHSYKKIYSSVDNYFKDLESVQNRVYKITNEKSMIIRFPGGSSNTVSKSYSKGIMTLLTNEVLLRGYHYFDWTSAVEDAGSCAGKSSESAKEKCVYNYFVKGLSKKRSNVVLMHDIKSYTASKLEDMIKYALDNGYTFDKITMDTVQIHHKVNN